MTMIMKAFFCLILLQTFFATISAEVNSSDQDVCDRDGFTFALKYDRSTTQCNGKSPIVDPRDDSKGVQCRVLCERFKDSRFRFNPVDTSCDICASNKASKYFGVDEGTEELDLCIEHKLCVEECGPPGEGCIYTGSCAQKWCAVTDDGSPGNFTEAPDTKGNVYNVAPGGSVVVGSQGTTVSTGDESTTSGNSETGDGDSVGNTAGDDNSSGKTLSKGAIIGISLGGGAVIVGAIVTITLALIRKRKRDTGSEA